MSWKDILKETIAENRVKEIEDINIDIDDDDCLRWLNNLHNIIERQPEGQRWGDGIRDEEKACAIKGRWEDKSNLKYFSGYNEGSVSLKDMYKDEEKYGHSGETNEESWLARVVFSFQGPNDDSHYYNILLQNWTKGFQDEKTSYFRTKGKTNKDKQKILKIVKEICTYLNLDYNKIAWHSI